MSEFACERSERLTFAQRLCRALPPILSYRLATRVFLRKRPPAGKRFVTTTITGGLFSFHSGDLLADQVRMCGFWDWRAQAIATVFCEAGDTIVEIGANTGTETVGFAQIVGPKGKVFAFEPLADIADALRYNARINGFDQIETIEAAVTDFNGTVSLQPGSSSTNSGQAYVGKSTDENGIEVPAVALDALEESIGCAKLITIDVEGHEVAVLRGAQHYIARYRPTIVVEAVANQLERAGSNLRELADQLTAMGYTVFQINRISVTRPKLNDAGEHYHLNWLCIPSFRALVKYRVNVQLLTCASMPQLFQPLNRRPRLGESKNVARCEKPNAAT
ncbi:MAG: FkbM family methyltransferase [Candidatus Eremiobacteraeota bacterium]|nr:FkbM family methyltransferase [Candidatus Eremiobacteraeota bacterium]